MESQQNRHPFPAPPGQQHSAANQQGSYQPHQPTQARPTTRDRTRARGFSFRSHNSSDKENTNNNNNHLIETHHEKEAKRLHSKADPNMAMDEAEPGMFCAQASAMLWSRLTGLIIQLQLRRKPDIQWGVFA